MAVQPWQGEPRPWEQGQLWQPPVQQAAMRAAHADRERTVDVLKAAFAEGRLSQDEYGQRVEAAYRSLTYGELAQLVMDLPSGPLVVPAGPMVPPTFMPMPPRPAPPTNGLAVTSLVLGVAGFLSLGIFSLPAVITGHAAKAQIRRTGDGGGGMATAGLVMGWLGVCSWVLLLLSFMVVGAGGG